MACDLRALEDLVRFARIEVESADVEPWAAILTDLYQHGVVNRDEALWLVKLYNAYDSLGSAWGVFRRWSDPYQWVFATDRAEAAEFPCTQERRGLRGGRVLKHLYSYVDHLAGDKQETWLWRGICINGTDDADAARRAREASFTSMLKHTRQVWGVGRQTAFEWAEFLGKVVDFPLSAGHAFLWESEGPRRSLQRIYGNDSPHAAWLDEKALETRAVLADAGIELSWEDLETIICDFNVMRDGRYYPGRHLAAVREEIEDLPNPHDRATLMESFNRVVPEPWRSIAPGIDKTKLPIYRNSGKMITEP